MNRSPRHFFFTAASVLALAIAGFFVAQAATNINVTYHWAWSNPIAWVNFYGTGNVNVTPTGITGYASSSIGYISFDCATSPSGDICGASNYKVTDDGTGNLSGYAWNDAVGWISFDCHNTGSCGTSNYEVTIDANGDFHNYAWNDILGWVYFNCADQSACGTSNYKVSSAWVATSTVGTLDSETYDTGVAKGVQLDSVLWKGTAPAGTSVQFQFAVGNTATGTWTSTFMGPDGTVNTYFTPVANTALSLTPQSGASPTMFTNYRYFRYRITLVATPTSTPQVNDVVVTWSP